MPWQPVHFNLSKKGNRMPAYIFSQSWNFRWRKKKTMTISLKQKPMNWWVSPRDISRNPYMESCTALLYTHRHYRCLIIQYFMISAHWAVPVHSPQFLYAYWLYISYWLVLKTEIFRTMTFCLHRLSRCICEKIREDKYRFCWICFVQQKVQIKPSIECHLFLRTENPWVTGEY